jgi:hypothetical protein
MQYLFPVDGDHRQRHGQDEPPVVTLDIHDSHSMAFIQYKFQILHLGRSTETRPAGARIKFCFRIKGRITTAHATIMTIFFAVSLFTSKGQFSSFSYTDLILLWGKLFSISLYPDCYYYFPQQKSSCLLSFYLR